MNKNRESFLDIRYVGSIILMIPMLLIIILGVWCYKQAYEKRK